MRQSKRIQKLGEITQLRKETDQFKLAQLQEKVEALKSNLKDLNARRVGHTYDIAQNQDAASIAVADLNWQFWVDQRIRKINAELAQVLAQVEECRAVLKQSFGKDLAAIRLQEKQVAIEEIMSKRRTSYES